MEFEKVLNDPRAHVFLKRAETMRYFVHYNSLFALAFQAVHVIMLFLFHIMNIIVENSESFSTMLLRQIFLRFYDSSFPFFLCLETRSSKSSEIHLTMFKPLTKFLKLFEYVEHGKLHFHDKLSTKYEIDFKRHC